MTNWSVAGNTLVLYVIGRHLGYRTTTNVYITTLCVADMAAAVASLLLAPMTGACVTWSVCVACARHVIFSSSQSSDNGADWIPSNIAPRSRVCMHVCMCRTFMFAQTLQSRLSRRRHGNVSVCPGEHDSFL